MYFFTLLVKMHALFRIPLQDSEVCVAASGAMHFSVRAASLPHFFIAPNRSYHTTKHRRGAHTVRLFCDIQIYKPYHFIILYLITS